MRLVSLLFVQHCWAASYTLLGTEFNQTAWSRQPYVSNGYIGQRIPTEGHGYWEIEPLGTQNGTSGWPLFDKRFTAAMVAGFYDVQDSTEGTNYPQKGGEQPISTIPTWSSLYVTLDGASYGPGVDPSQVSNYSQSMSIQNGIVSTSLLWTPPNLNAIHLNYTIFAHRNRPNLGVVHLGIKGIPENATLTVTDVLDGAGSWRTTPKGSGSNSSNIVWTAVSPLGVTNVTAYEVSSFQTLVGNFSSLENNSSCFQGLSRNASTSSRCYAIKPSSGKATLVKYVGIASSDDFSDPMARAIESSKSGLKSGYKSILAEHNAAWDELFHRADIVVPGESQELKELQLVTRASLFHLISNVRSGDETYGPGHWSIAPAGLTSDSYAGQIFWDADIWMFPSLLVLWPRYAQSITNFRSRQLGQARINAVENNRTGAMYPWTAGRYGNCTGVGPCVDYEYHLMNDIALAQYQYYATENNDTWLRKSGWPVISSVAEFWASQVQFNSSLGNYTVNNVTDPDEYANHQNNGAFTNAGINGIMRYAAQLASILGIDIPSEWAKIAERIQVSTDPQSGITLEFDGFNGSTEVKQADVVLLTYPLEYHQDHVQGLEDLDYYALKTSPNGPGMTYSVYSIAANALSNGIGCASWTYLLAASQPYVRAPFYQFSEQQEDVYNDNGGTNPAFTFLTGHGGYIQSRLNKLYFDPIMVPQLTNYTIKGFYYHQSRFDITMTSDVMHIAYASGFETIKVEIGPYNPKKGIYTIKPGSSLSIPVRSSTTKLVKGNLAQCRPLYNNNDTSFSLPSRVVPGQYGLAAIDGSNSTVWQPSSNETSSLIVDLGSSKSFTKLHFNWGENPAKTFAVAAGATTSDLRKVASGRPNITAPYDAATAALVRIVVGNTTDIALGKTVSARYVQVNITGSSLDDGVGATLAEFAVIAS